VIYLTPWIITGILFLLLIFLRAYVKYQKNKIPIYPKKPIISKPEGEFFKILKNLVGNEYDIFAQVQLVRLIDAPFRSVGWNKTSQKSVDFVLVDKNDFSTKLVIELDGASHKFASRIERDKLVDQILKNAKIPILHHPWQQHYDPQNLRVLINSKLS